MFTTFDEVRRVARESTDKTFVIAGAGDDFTVETAVLAAEEKAARPILVGQAAKVEELLRARNANPADFEIIDSETDQDACARAVKMAREGEADIILKGSVATSTIIRAALDKEKGLRTGRLLSDVFLFENDPADEGPQRLIAVSDGGVNPMPNLEQKKQILQNALDVLHALGNECPKVAVMSATEKVSDSIPSTAEARALQEMNERGEITGCVIEGPVAFDVAMFKWCAEMKGISSKVSGEVDLMLAPSFEAGNMMAKVFVFCLKRRIGHMLMGAKAPILINSRTDNADQRLNSIALTSVLLEKLPEIVH